MFEMINERRIIKMFKVVTGETILSQVASSVGEEHYDLIEPIKLTTYESPTHINVVPGPWFPFNDGDNGIKLRKMHIVADTDATPGMIGFYIGTIMQMRKSKEQASKEAIIAANTKPKTNEKVH